ncbi:helix-turn-helix domain-containing protein [Streptomyces olivaceus]|nr:helix-turn-helix domain-containing protein [Streptomyces olivaceus]
MQGDERSGLGEYLRHHRSQMAPRDRPGASPLSHRRVPGLRRQELADIASISVEYYTRLEQGRAVRPSREVLTALARAFRLSNAEREHLFRLAGERPPPSRGPATEIRPGLQQLLDGLNDVVPVTIHDGRLDMLALNTAAAALFGPLFDDGPTAATSPTRPSPQRDSTTYSGTTGPNNWPGWPPPNSAKDSATTRRTSISAPCSANSQHKTPSSNATGEKGRSGPGVPR